MHIPGPDHQLRLCKVMAKMQPGREAPSEMYMLAKQCPATHAVGL